MKKPLHGFKSCGQFQELSMPILMEFYQKMDTAVSLDIFNGFGIYISLLAVDKYLPR